MKPVYFSLCLLFVYATVQGQDGIMNQGSMLSREVYHEIAYSQTREEIFENVQLKGRSLKFILDTGAPLCLSKEVQQDMKYPVLHTVPLKDAHNKTDTIHIVQVDTIRIGELLFANIPALILDFKNSPIGCQAIDGIIGSNIVRFLIVQFDIKRQRVILTDLPEKIHLSAENQSFPLFLDPQSNAFTKIRFSETHTDSAHFDTGMGKLYDMNIQFAQSLVKNSLPSPHRYYKGYGIPGQGILGNAAPEEMLYLHTSFSLGGHYLRDAEISTTQTVSRIGRELFQFGILTLDYPGKKFNFHPFSMRNSSPRKNFGFDIIVEAKKVSIGIVWEGTPAEKKGLKSGMELTKINGITFSGKNACEISNQLNHEFKKEEIKVTYFKGSHRRTIRLKAI